MGKRVTQDQDTVILNIEVPPGTRIDASTTSNSFSDTLILNLGIEDFTNHAHSAGPAESPANYPAHGYPAQGYPAQGYSAQGYQAPQYSAPSYAGPSYAGPSYAGPNYSAPAFSSPAFSRPLPPPPGAPGGYPLYLAPTNVKPVNTSAQSAMSVGITSLVLSFMPLIGTFAWFLAPAGLVKSTRALTQAEVTGVGHSESVTGIVTSLTSLLICLMWVYQLWP